MIIHIKHTNNAELRDRKEAVVKELSDAYASIEGAPLTMRDIKELGELGCLSSNERNLYDELLQIEVLLDEN